MRDQHVNPPVAPKDGDADLASPGHEVDLLPSGVPGLDEVLGGGVPELSFNLIVGASGTGKTTLAMQILFANATAGHTGLFVTLIGEPPVKLLRYQRRFDFFDVRGVGERVHFLTAAREVAASDLDAVLQRIRVEVERMRPRVLVIDSFHGLARMLSGQHTMKLEVFSQHMAEFLASWEATSFLICDHPGHDGASTPIFTIADGILLLSQSIDRNSVVRKLQVAKMRGLGTMPGLHTLRISRRGIQVYPRIPQEHGPVRDHEGKRLSMGIPGLDEMMGGGIPVGDALLIAGSAGTGKTIFASQFVAEGLRRGEGCVVAVFEERPEQYVARAQARGVDFASAQRAGRLGVVYVRPLDLSVDETFDEIRATVAATAASRVVIDSISGFEMALAPTFREDFRESLYRLVNALTGLGVTIVMTSEAGSELGASATKDSVSFLTDDIIQQQLVEIEGQLRKVLTVVKMRGSRHSRDFRTYDMTDSGVEMGALLREYRGIMGRSPELQGPARNIGRAGLTDQEALVLETIIQWPNRTMGAVAERAQLPQDVVSVIIDRLCQLGYVLRTPGPDGDRHHGLAQPYGK